MAAGGVEPLQALRFQAVSKAYGRTRVFDSLHLDIAPGEVFALVGLNGAGKTTLIKSLLDLSDIDGGSISIFDKGHRRFEARRRVAFLPEDFRPPYFLTAREFLRYSAGLYGNVLSESELGPLNSALDFDQAALGRSVRKLSKGMGQKLGLLACFLSGRELLVLDEPMSGLDPKARASVRAYLRGLKDVRRTLFFSTHLLEDVEALCDRMGVLHGGGLRFIGTPEECCRRYQTPELEAAFLRCIEN